MNCPNQALFYVDNFVIGDVSFRNGRAAESCKNDEIRLVEFLNTKLF